MNEKQLFSVLVQGIGVVTFLDGFRVLYFAATTWTFEPSIRHFSAGITIGPEVMYGLVIFILGGILVRWPHWVVHLAWLERLPTIGRMADHDISD